MNISIEEMPREIARLEDENEELQQRINKAVELIEADYFEDGSGENIEKVLEILKGSEQE